MHFTTPPRRAKRRIAGLAIPNATPSCNAWLITFSDIVSQQKVAEEKTVAEEEGQQRSRLRLCLRATQTPPYIPLHATTSNHISPSHTHNLIATLIISITYIFSLFHNLQSPLPTLPPPLLLVSHCHRHHHRRHKLPSDDDLRRTSLVAHQLVPVP
nr:hypothetical transcript [Hymenolepis microstoma]